MTAGPSTPPPRLAQWLGYLGLIPFVGLAPALWWAPAALQPTLAMALLGYGAVIVSFLGAIHWGFAMHADPATVRATSLLWAVTPSLGAWVALMLQPAHGLALIALGLAACFLVDRTAYRQFAGSGWLPMRLRLTAVAGIACLAGAWGLVR